MGEIRQYVSGAVTVTYEAARCRHFAECVRGLPEVFDVGKRPWIQPGNANPEAIAEVIRRCPSGALHYRLADGPDEEPDPVTSVTALPGGPLLLRGDLRIRLRAGEPAGSPAAASAPTELTETRMAACACGRTANAPFCDGACQPGH